MGKPVLIGGSRLWPLRRRLCHGTLLVSDDRWITSESTLVCFNERVHTCTVIIRSLLTSSCYERAIKSQRGTRSMNVLVTTKLSFVMFDSLVDND